MRMIPDLDIYRTANVLVKQHGQDATIHAAMRTDVGTKIADTSSGRLTYAMVESAMVSAVGDYLIAFKLS